MTQVVLSTNTTAPPRAFNNTFSQPKNGWYIPVQNVEEEKKKKSHKLGITIAASAILIGFGTLAMTKGVVPKYLSKHLDKWKLQLEQKLHKDGRLSTFYQKTLDFVTSWSEKSKSINNINSLKDVLFERLMCGKDGNRPFTSKIHRGITKIFNKLSRSTVNSSYAKTQRKFASLNESLAAINAKVLKENPANKAVLDNIETAIKNMNNEYEAGFGLNARNSRLKELQTALTDLFDEFWGKSFNGKNFKDIIKNFRQKDMYQSFIAEAVMQPAKTVLVENTAVKRNAVTNITDQILKQYETILPNNDYLKVKNKIKSAVNSLNSSIETETGKYFDKARDMKLGSAPTDVLSIVAGLGTVGWFTAKSKDKDERISSVLRYGIPAIGTIATSLYCNARLVSGAKGIMLGILSGMAVNKIGTAVDNARKKYTLDISLQNKTILKPQSDKV